MGSKKLVRPRNSNAAEPKKTRTEYRRRLRILKKTKINTNLADQIILNDANFALGPAHMKVLNRGISFIPYKRIRPDDVRGDLERLRRNLNLRFYWQIRGGQYQAKSYLSEIIPSVWNPPETLKKDEKLWEELAADCSKTSPDPGKSNFPKHLRSAWDELKNNKAFFLLKADKGGKLVLWSRNDYEVEALRQLNDQETYSRLSETENLQRMADLHISFRTLVQELCTQGNITKSEADRTLERESRTPGIYFLPKIHKPKRTDTGTYPGRPILAAVTGPLKPLDEFIARTVAPLLKKIPGSLTDTRDLIQHLSEIGPSPRNAILFSADVESLYPSIDWEEGRKAATNFYIEHFNFLEKLARDRKILPPPKPGLFEKILKTILEKNIFHFRDKHWFHQRRGTAMGCSISVYLANTFLFYRTKHLQTNPPTQLLYLGRYIDDLIGVWNGPPGDIPNIFLGVIDDKIKLTYDIGGNSLTALDLTLFFGKDGLIGTRLYRKPTDGHQFIHWTSSHAKHVKTGVLYSQLLRIKRNCSEEADYQREKSNLIARFRQRGYPNQEIGIQEARVDLLSRRTLLEPRAPRERKTERLNFVTTFHKENVFNIRKGLNTFWRKLKESAIALERTGYVNGEVIPGSTPRITFRNGKSLGSTLGPSYKRGDRDLTEKHVASSYD